MLFSLWNFLCRPMNSDISSRLGVSDNLYVTSHATDSQPLDDFKWFIHELYFILYFSSTFRANLNTFCTKAKLIGKVVSVETSISYMVYCFVKHWTKHYPGWQYRCMHICCCRLNTSGSSANERLYEFGVFKSDKVTRLESWYMRLVTFMAENQDTFIFPQLFFRNFSTSFWPQWENG